jgi:hypothetical protein
VHFGLAAAKREQRALVLARAFAKNPEWFPNGRPLPKSLSRAAWINPSAKREAGLRGESTVARHSSAAPIVVPGATSNAVTEAEPLARPHLMLEDRCMVAVQ